MNAARPDLPRAAAAGSPFGMRRQRLVQYSFLTLYLVWGVSFAAGRIMATNLPALLSAGLRFCLAGTLVTAIVYARGLTLPSRAAEWRVAAITATLGIVLSNGLNVLALRHAPSNQVALINASSAFWIAWLGMYGRQPSPVSARTWVGLALGFLGVAVLVSAHGFGPRAHFLWQLVALGAALAWALATWAMRESQSDCDPLVFTACYLLLGGPALVAIGAASGDVARWSWSPAGLGALLFLALFSSTLAFLAYSYLLRHEAPARVGTYAYVNPLVAVFAGWLLLGEGLTAVQWLGSAIIFLGVIVVRNLRLFPRGLRRA